MVLAAAQHQEEACPWCGQQISRAQFVKIEARIRDEEKRRHDQVATEIRATLAAEQAERETRFKADKTSLELQLKQLRDSLEKANEDKAAFDRKLKEATVQAAEAERKKLEAELALKLKTDVDRERELVKTQLVKQAAEHQTATKVLQKQIAELQRKVAQQANEKPEVVDIDVVEELKAALKGDRVLPLPKTDKSDSGANVLVEVKYKNTVCGKILIDSRTRGNWQSLYATKLRADMRDQGADHAILATLHFPKGASEFHRHDDVLLVHPTRIVQLVALLRDTLVHMAKNKLSQEQRAEKKARLYDHITSTSFRRKLADLDKTTDEIDEIDADEQDTHQKVWKKRGIAMQRLQKLQRQVIDEIDDIVDGIEGDDDSSN